MCVYLVVFREFLRVKRSQFVARLFYGEGMEDSADTAEVGRRSKIYFDLRYFLWLEV